MFSRLVYLFKIIIKKDALAEYLKKLDAILGKQEKILKVSYENCLFLL